MATIESLHLVEYAARPSLIVSAPGVANLMGAYTEGTDGSVLLFGINRRAFVSVGHRNDASMRFFAADLNERKRTSASALRYHHDDRFSALVKGVVARLQALGAHVGGFDATISSEIPSGIGLAGSQAIAVALATALAELFEFRISPLEAAQVAHFAEHVHAGVDVGLATFLSSALSRPGHAMLIDTHRLDWSYVRLDLDGAALFGVDTHAPFPASAEEAARRQIESERCFSLLGGRRTGRLGGCSYWEFDADDLADGIGRVPERSRRYCLHIVSENDRVMSAAEALRRRDLRRVGKLLLESHRSQSDLYEVSSPEVDWLVKHTQEVPGIYGARLAGGSTGSCAILLARSSSAPGIDQCLREYERIFGFHPTLLTCGADEGVRVDGREGT